MAAREIILATLLAAYIIHSASASGGFDISGECQLLLTPLFPTNRIYLLILLLLSFSLYVRWAYVRCYLLWLQLGFLQGLPLL